jgi:hypothetical protein
MTCEYPPQIGGVSDVMGGAERYALELARAVGRRWTS